VNELKQSELVFAQHPFTILCVSEKVYYIFWSRAFYYYFFKHQAYNLSLKTNWILRDCRV